MAKCPPRSPSRSREAPRSNPALPALLRARETYELRDDIARPFFHVLMHLRLPHRVRVEAGSHTPQGFQQRAPHSMAALQPVQLRLFQRRRGGFGDLQKCASRLLVQGDALGGARVLVQQLAEPGERVGSGRTFWDEIMNDSSITATL